MSLYVVYKHVINAHFAVFIIYSFYPVSQMQQVSCSNAIATLVLWCTNGIKQKQLLVATIILVDIFSKYFYRITLLPMYLIVAYLKTCIGDFGTIFTLYLVKFLNILVWYSPVCIGSYFPSHVSSYSNEYVPWQIYFDCDCFWINIWEVFSS